jgi:UDP-3-O-[3-hydroxymyristoyl] glucosamine N-acyltransferase
MNVAEIASIIDAVVEGDGTREITGVAKIEQAKSDEITFLANPKYEKFLGTTAAGAIIVSKKQNTTILRDRTITVLKVDDPYVSFVKVLSTLSPVPEPFAEGIHPTAVVDQSARVGKNVSIGAYAVIEESVSVGDGSRIGPHVVIGKGSRIGANCRFYANTTVYHGSIIGNNVVLHSGSVVGGDGFGFAPKKDGTYEKVPQLGIVRIEDDVEIGANTCIDRATLGETVIRRGVKLDNIIQIGHNCDIGEHTVIAALSGVAGSTRLGKNCMIAASVGIAGHLHIADRTVLLARSGVPKSITEPGQKWFGAPPREARRAFRIEAVINNLPELAQQVDELQRKLKNIEEKNTPHQEPSTTS